MITPIEFNKQLHKISSIIKKDFPACNIAIDALQKLENRHFDSRYFTKSIETEIKKHIGTAIIFLFVQVKEATLEEINAIRTMFDPILARELLFVNRFLKHEKDIGTLSKLPDLALFEIRRHVHEAILVS